MSANRILDLLQQIADGGISPSVALERLALDPSESLPFATIDHHRTIRQGYPEVIFGPGKTAAQTVAIAERLAERGDGFLVTRAELDARIALAERFPTARINAVARTVHLAGSNPVPVGTGTILIVTAGTGDLPVADEAAETATAMGNIVSRLTDVGVAGIHRLLSRGEELRELHFTFEVWRQPGRGHILQRIQ